MPRRIPSNIARNWLELDPVFLDTETTGIENAQVCDIAILALDGTPIVDTLVRPTFPIPSNAIAVHGITNEMVAVAPGFAEVWPIIKTALSNHWIVAYNADYDRARLWDSAHAVEIDAQRFLYRSLSRPYEPHAPHWLCAMELYAEFHGERDAHHSNYRWQKLGDALAQCSLALPGDVPLHRARADAEAARRLVLHMAGRTS